MHGKRVLSAVLMLCLLSLACNFGREIIPASPTQTATSTHKDMEKILRDMGGAPCEEQPEFTCVTIKVPLDHFDPANTETLDVVFAVHPATDVRYGMFLQAYPGGPGGEGISTAATYFFPEEILAHFDLVFFDQRGIGLSSPLSCPTTYGRDFLKSMNGDDTLGEEGFDTPEEQAALISDTRTFVDDCITEMGVDPSRLQFYGTDQVVEDMDTFRALIGDEKIWLYGVSYGTQVAQMYAAAHPDRLYGLILDGTSDLTLSGEESTFSQEKAMQDVLLATFKACDENADCAADMGTDALTAYRSLEEKLAQAPIPYTYPLPSGGTASASLTFSQLEYTVGYQLYGQGTRTMLLRALAAANHGDMVPMARLYYASATVDPATGAYLGDPTFSDAGYLMVACRDWSFYEGTPEERIAKVIEAGQASNGIEPPLDGFIYFGATCADWPGSPSKTERQAPLTAKGIPVLVLNATLDPATPFHEGKAVFERLDNGYHIYVEGGRHSIFGWGQACPDQYVNDFLVKGKLPAQREIKCEGWGGAILDLYVPSLPEDVSAFSDPMQMMRTVDEDLYLLPEVYYGTETGATIGCNHGGTYTLELGDGTENHIYTNCSPVKGLILNGSGVYDDSTKLFTMEVTVSGAKEGQLTYTLDYSSGRSTLTGEYGGEAIDITE